MNNLARVFKTLLIVALCSLIVQPVWGQTPEPSSSAAAPMAVEQAAKLREQAKQFSTALGNPPSKEEQHKNVGDVADKALDIFSGMIGAVSESLKKVAPEVWR